LNEEDEGGKLLKILIDSKDDWFEEPIKLDLFIPKWFPFKFP